MKIQITFKDPDGVSDSIDTALKKFENEYKKLHGELPADMKYLGDTKREEIEDSIKAFVEYSEYVTIEIDTEKNTARVLKVNEH